MKKHLCELRYISFFIFLSIFHVMISVAQTNETNRKTILQQLLNNVGKTVTADELKKELKLITEEYRLQVIKDMMVNNGGMNNEIMNGVKMLPIMKLEKKAERGYVDKKLIPIIKEKLENEEQVLMKELKKEELLLDAKQKASRVAELEKELGEYIPETNIHRRSQLQLFAGYSYDDVVLECKRLESAEETVKTELEQAKAAHTVQEERNNILLGHIQTIADTIPLIKNAIRKHLDDKTWDKGVFGDKIVYDEKIRLGRTYTEKDLLDEQERLESIKNKLLAYLQTLLDKKEQLRRKETWIDSIYVATGRKLKKNEGGYNRAEAIYSYFELPDGERVFHGDFHLVRKLYPIQIHGKFDKGKRTGTWTFNKNKFKLSVTYKKDKLQSISCKYGENPTPLIALTFNNGEINGYAKRIDLFTSSITPLNIAFGNVKQTVKFPEDESIIRCAFDADGYPNGLWTTEYTENGNRYKIEEAYEHGILKNMTRTDLSVTGKRTEIPLKEVHKTYPISTTVREILSYFEDYSLEIPGVVTYKIRRVQIAKEKKLPTEGVVFTTVQSMPEFPGGNEALRKFIKDNTRKDLTLQTGNNSVYVQFTVNHDGSLTDIEAKGNDVLAKAAVRIVTAMPKWIPGIQYGETCRVRTSLRIDFNK